MVKTNTGSKLSICATPQNADLTLVEFEALTYVPIAAIGSFGESGVSTNMLTYPTWDTTVTQKAKGNSDAGSPDLEVARIADDPGQAILRTAGDPFNNQNFAIKEERNDAPPGGTPTFIYHRGLIAGPRRPRGRNEDFDLEVYTIGLQQKEVVDPAAEAP